MENRNKILDLIDSKVWSDECDSLIKTLTPIEINGEVGERSLLTQACRKGNFKIAHALIDRGADVNHRYEGENKTLGVLYFEYDRPLLAAVGTSYLVPRPEWFDDTLHATPIEERLRLVLHLLEKGADSTIHDIGDNPCWFQAMDLNSLELAKLFVSFGANPLDRGFENDPPLRWALQKGLLDFAKWMVAHGAEVNDADDWENSCLQAAIFSDKPEILKWIIDEGVDLQWFSKRYQMATPVQPLNKNLVLGDCQRGLKILWNSFDFLLGVLKTDELEDTLLQHTQHRRLLDEEMVQKIHAELDFRQLSLNLPKVDTSQITNINRL